ncbi:hypothetical protein [Streptomyces sp. NPDC054783]
MRSIGWQGLVDQQREFLDGFWLAALLEAPRGAAGVTDPHARLLLLLPVLGDAAVPEEAVTAVVEALVAQGAPEPSEALARHLLQGHPMWGAEDWWFDDDEQSWLCEGDHSPRKAPLGDHLPPQQRADLEACLTPR